MSVRITSHKRIIILLVCFIIAIHSVKGQCSSFISSFPYSEGFETSDGGWFSGGTASGWVWGTPIKPVITAAASGTRCWVTATLTQSLYNNNENSRLTSPCFDCTSLTAPYIKFNVFWKRKTNRMVQAFNIQLMVVITGHLLVWYAEYILAGMSKQLRKGTILLIK